MAKEPGRILLFYQAPSFMGDRRGNRYAYFCFFADCTCIYKSI